jgi:DNA-binding response OmpR family regulator
MNKTEIMVTGRNDDTVKFVVELINSNKDWVATTAATDEEAIEKFHQRNFNMVVLASDLDNEEERKLRKIFTIQNPDIIILKHYGKNDNLLANEIIAALDKQRKEKKPSFSFVDDALKNAGLNIIVQ